MTEQLGRKAIMIVRIVDNTKRECDLATSIQVIIPAHSTKSEAIEIAKAKIHAELDRYVIEEAIGSLFRKD